MVNSNNLLTNLKTSLFIVFLLCAVALTAIPQPAYAQINEFKLMASDGAIDDQFGNSVSISGDYAVVGAFRDDDNGDGSGSAYIFKRTSASWTQEAKLLPSDGAAGDAFGSPVSISGDYAVVGAHMVNNFWSGAAYIFKRTGTNWAEEAKLLPSDGRFQDFFGGSVSISGDYVVIGASGDDDNGLWSGSAYVFKRSDTSWTQEAKLLPADGAANDSFGSSVSISGDYVVIGASGDDDNGDRSGSAYVFKRTGESWVQEAKLLASDGAADNIFGGSVSISGDYAVVGAHLGDDNGEYSGSAYVFKRTGESWEQEAKLFPSDGEANDFFGWSVSISGDYAVVGAYWDDDNGNDAGSAYVFKRTGASWAQEAKLLPSDGATNDFFGRSVSISGEYAVVGSQWIDDIGRIFGSAYVFKRIGTSWAQEDKLFASDGAAGDLFGRSVSISGDYAVVGAQWDDDNGSSSGSAYLYTGFAAPVGIEHEKAGMPAEFSLSQNYPNPFNPETLIEFALPLSGDVSLVVYNLHGEEVARLLSGVMPAGNHRISWDASDVASGIYFYRLQVRQTDVGQAGDFVQTKKMVLLK